MLGPRICLGDIGVLGLLYTHTGVGEEDERGCRPMCGGSRVHVIVIFSGCRSSVGSQIMGLLVSCFRTINSSADACWGLFVGRVTSSRPLILQRMHIGASLKAGPHPTNPLFGECMLGSLCRPVLHGTYRVNYSSADARWVWLKVCWLHATEVKHTTAPPTARFPLLICLISSCPHFPP